MKKLMFLFLSFFLLITCKDDDSKLAETSFLKDIRPEFFENTNYDSEAVVGNIPNYMRTFGETFSELEKKYNEGKFTSDSDLEYMRLMSMYFSFYLLSLGGNYIDGNISFQNIQGNHETGYFSGLNQNEPDFEKKEMAALMERAVEVIHRAVNINGYNDKTYGFYVAVKQVEQRVKNNNFSTLESHNLAIDYVGVRLVHYDLIANWNVLMSMVTMTNYEDSLNTFDNPRMNELLFHVNARLIPGSLPDLGGRYPEIMGPMFRFDLNLKKIDWILSNYEYPTQEQLSLLDYHIQVLETSSSFLVDERDYILETWPHKSTFDDRLKKLEEIKYFRETLDMNYKPELKQFINSKDFKRAYQCYSCHRPSGLY